VEKVCEKINDPVLAEFVEVVTGPAVSATSSSRAVLPGALKRELRKSVHMALRKQDVREQTFQTFNVE